MKKLLCIMLALLLLAGQFAWATAETLPDLDDLDAEETLVDEEYEADEEDVEDEEFPDDEGADEDLTEDMNYVEDEDLEDDAEEEDLEENEDSGEDAGDTADADDGDMPIADDADYLEDVDEDDIMPEVEALIPEAEVLEAEGFPAVSKTTKADIRVLQRLLIKEGLLTGEADGIYGEQTEQAVAEWCARNNVISQNESVFTLLVRMRRAKPASDPSTDSTTVYIVQRLLHQWGFLTDDPDGKNGKNTQKALTRFMSYASSEMAEFLREREAALARAQAPSVIDDDMPRVEDELLTTSDSFSADGRLTQAWYDFITSGYAPGVATVTEGTKSTDALRVQNRLHELKYIAAGIDGYFGKNTALALKYFQLRNKLKASGECDDKTAAVLFSDKAKASDKYVAPYMARVVTSKSKTYILKWTGKDYTKVVKTFTCSCGKPSTPTKKGTYQAKGPVTDWYYMPSSRVWVRYAFQIKGNYFFHSVLFNSKGSKHPTYASVHNLGSNVSHGCVRLSVKDAKWLFKNCTAGMTVVIE